MVHLQENGYSVEKIDTSNDELAKLKESLGIAPELASCHTAEVGGYLVEGHVPADVIDELLLEEPAITGLSVPGMPPGSPGMDGQLREPMDILAFDQDGNVWVYTTWQ